MTVSVSLAACLLAGGAVTAALAGVAVLAAGAAALCCGKEEKEEEDEEEVEDPDCFCGAAGACGIYFFSSGWKIIRTTNVKRKTSSNRFSAPGSC